MGKLTEQQVEQVWELLNKQTPGMTDQLIANQYGVDRSTITRIRLGNRRAIKEITPIEEVVESPSEKEKEKALLQEIKQRFKKLQTEGLETMPKDGKLLKHTRKETKKQHKENVGFYHKQIIEIQKQKGLRIKELHEMTPEELLEYKANEKKERKRHEDELIRIAQHEFRHNKIVVNRDFSITPRKTRSEWLQLAQGNKRKNYQRRIK